MSSFESPSVLPLPSSSFFDPWPSVSTEEGGLANRPSGPHISSKAALSIAPLKSRLFILATSGTGTILIF